MKIIFASLILSLSFYSCSNSNKNPDTEKSPKQLLFHSEEMCEIYYELGQMEKSTRNKAEEKFPAFGDQQNEYLNKLRKEGTKNICNKYGISDSIVTLINVYGLQDCK